MITGRRFILFFWLILTISLPSLFSCAPSDFEILSSKELSLRNQGNYESYLALEYLDFARRLNLADDKKSADYFAQKGVRIAIGEPFIPENPLAWKADKMQIEELILTQRRLEQLLDQGILIEKLPIQLAHLSYLYDCWVAKESQPLFRESEPTKCHSTYSTLINEIENYAKKLNKKNPTKTINKDPEFTRFEVSFDERAYNINEKAGEELFRILKYLNTIRENYTIYLIGNGDSAAKTPDNQEIAMNRTKEVMNHLVKNGVPNISIKPNNEGENFPDIISLGSSYLFNNRTVGVYIIRAEGEIPSYPMPLLQNLLYRQQVKEAQAERGIN